MVESSNCFLIQAAHLMLDCIPEDLLHNVLDRLSSRDTARLLCVSPQLHEAVFCAMSSINLTIDPQSPEEAHKRLYWLAAVSARPRTYSRLYTLQLQILAPADKFKPALKLPETVQLRSFINLRRLDLWQRSSDTETFDWKTAEWIWDTSTIEPDPLSGQDLLGNYVMMSPHVARQLTALVNLEELHAVIMPHVHPSHREDGPQRENNGRPGLDNPICIPLECTEFAAIPSLQQIKLAVPQASRASDNTIPNVRLKLPNTGFEKLRALEIDGLWSVDANEGFQKLVGRLERLRLHIKDRLLHIKDIKEPILQVMPATELTYLSFGTRFRPSAPATLPFQTSDQLQHYFSGQAGLYLDPSEISSRMPNLTSLAWGDSKRVDNDVTPNDVALLNLKKLHNLRIHSLVPVTTDHPVLSCFTGLERLEVLMMEVDYSSCEGFPKCLLPEYWSMPKLKLLCLEFFWFEDFNLYRMELNLNCFPSLAVCKVGRVLLSGDLQSCQLTTLECGFDDTRCLRFGNLPRLRNLKLILQWQASSMGTSRANEEQVIRMLADMLSGLPALRDLTLEKRKGTWGYTADDRIACPAQSDGFIQKMLTALCALESLEKLHLEDLTSNVHLRREGIPRVKTLRLKCKELQICACCLPWRESCITFECMLPADVGEKQRLLESLKTSDLTVCISRLHVLLVRAWKIQMSPNSE